jgi:tetratricopeptide (TPR) repeat protein
MSDTAVSMRKRINGVIQHAFNTKAEPNRLFSLGLLCYMAKMLPEANSVFSRVHELCPEDTLYSSFYGLTLAVVEKDVDTGLKLCKAALSKDSVNPEVYWILGQVYLFTGQRKKAFRIFKEGLFIDNDCAYLKTALRKLGVRKKSVFSFLSRNHSLNILAGKLRAMATSRETLNNNERHSGKASSLPLYDMLQSKEKKLWAHLNGHNEVSLDRLWLLHV